MKKSTKSSHNVSQVKKSGTTDMGIPSYDLKSTSKMNMKKSDSKMKKMGYKSKSC
jgi:hypothetical protein